MVGKARSWLAVTDDDGDGDAMQLTGIEERYNVRFACVALL